MSSEPLVEGGSGHISDTQLVDLVSGFLPDSLRVSGLQSGGPAARQDPQDLDDLSRPIAREADPPIADAQPPSSELPEGSNPCDAAPNRWIKPPEISLGGPGRLIFHSLKRDLSGPRRGPRRRRVVWLRGPLQPLRAHRRSQAHHRVERCPASRRAHRSPGAASSSSRASAASSSLSPSNPGPELLLCGHVPQIVPSTTASS